MRRAVAVPNVGDPDALIPWLVDTSWPGDGWLAQFRERLDLPTQPRP